MLKKLFVLLPSMLIASSAQATFLAGWDFGQYLGPGAPSIDGVNPVSTIPANYSDLDPTFGAGAESGAFGTAYLDGTNGSTPGAGTTLILPNAGSLGANLGFPQDGTPVGDVPFDSGTVQNNEVAHAAGTHQFVSLLTQNAVSISFAANGGGQPLENLQLDFGGQSQGAAGTVDISVSTDGTSYSFLEQVALAAEQTFTVLAPGVTGNEVFFQLSFSGAQLDIDNVAISGDIVPEPSTALLLLTGLAGIARAGRRRE